ncbi:MAG: preQ(1) synthase [Tepidisphaeraceae bacterium]
MKRKLRHLGHKTAMSERLAAEPRGILDTFANPRVGRDYEIRFEFPEFTSICPVTGQPDFATIEIEYVPDRLCVEMKSLKLYFHSYRDRGVFYEDAVNKILDDLVAVVKPRRMRVVGEFAVRGGMGGVVTAHYQKGAR